MITNVFYIGSDGKRRNGKQVVCQKCNKTFVARRTWNPKYCSIVCRGSACRTRVPTTCAQCGTAFEICASKFKNSAKSGLHFCSRLCKDTAQRLGGIQAIQPSHYGKGEENYRTIFVANGGKFVCQRCGYAEFSSSVEVHHKDHNHSNNDPNNLMPLCANCHSAWHKFLWKFE